jgi:hypothetical protein
VLGFSVLGFSDPGKAVKDIRITKQPTGQLSWQIGVTTR